MNARSEFVEPTNCVEGGVFETRRRFHAASPAFSRIRAVAESRRRGRSPTRGSGLGGVVDMLIAGDALVLLPEAEDDAHAVTYRAPAARAAPMSGAARP